MFSGIKPVASQDLLVADDAVADGLQLPDPFPKARRLHRARGSYDPDSIAALEGGGLANWFSAHDIFA